MVDVDKQQLTELLSKNDLEHLHWLAIFVAAIASNGPIIIKDEALVAAPRLVDGIVGSLMIQQDIERYTTTFYLLDAPGEDIPYAGD